MTAWEREGMKRKKKKERPTMPPVPPDVWLYAEGAEMAKKKKVIHGL